MRLFSLPRILVIFFSIALASFSLPAQKGRIPLVPTVTVPKLRLIGFAVS